MDPDRDKSREANLFNILTPHSLRSLLTEPAESLVLSPNPDFFEGNQLPSKYLELMDSKSMTCIPLDEIDPAYKNFKTFIVIGKFGTIHRYSARKALEALSPLNPVRKWALLMTNHWAFSLLMSIVVVLNLVFIQNDVGKFFEHSTTVLYGIEFFLKIVSEGLIRDPFTYFRKPWNWLDVAVIGSSVARPLRSVPVLFWIRALKLIQLTPGARRWLWQMTKTVFKLRSTILLSVFCVFLLSIFGKLMFLGVFTSRCVSYSSYWEQLAIISLSNDTSPEVVTWKDFAQNSNNWISDDVCLTDNEQDYMECPDDDYDFECIQGAGANPDYGLTNFDSFRASLIQTVRIVDQDYLEDILMKLALASFRPAATVLFFVALYFFGTYLFGVLFYAVIGNYTFSYLTKKFNNEKKHSPQNNETRSSEENREEGNIPTKRDPVLFFVHQLLNNVFFEVFITSFILLDIFAMTLYRYDLTPSFTYYFSRWIPRIAWVVYAVELAMKLFYLGWLKYFTNGWNIFESLTLVDMALQLFHKRYPFSFPIRAFKLMPRWTTLRLTFDITVNCVRQLWGISIVLISIGSHLAFVGMSEFRNDYLQNINAFGDKSIPRWNFVNFFQSARTVFRSFIGESIEVLRECLVAGGSSCFFFFYSTALTSSLILMTATVGVIYVTDKTLKYEAMKKKKPSVLAKMLCYPYVWLKQQADKDTIAVPTRTGISTIYNTLKPPDSVQKLIDGRKFVRCSPPPKGSQVLRGVSTFIILVFSAVLVLDDIPAENDVNIESLIFAIDAVFTVFISIMLGYSFVICGTKYCLTSPGWIFDLCVVLEAIVNFLYDLNPEANPYPTFYFFRSLRPFMLISRVEMLETVFRGLLRELKFLWKYVAVGIFIWLNFAIFGTKVFGGHFRKCVDESDHIVAHVLDQNECLASNNTWTNPYFNFDSLGRSFLSLALVGQRNEWVNLVNDATDIQPSRQTTTSKYAQYNVLFFATFFVFGVFLVINIVFGVIYFNINQYIGLFLTKEQLRESYLLRKKRVKPEYFKSSGKYLAKLDKIVRSVYFDIFVLLIVFTDVALLAAEDAETLHWDNEPSVIPELRLAVFAIYCMEAILKIIAWQSTYFYNGWNQLDILVVATGIAELILAEFEIGVRTDYIRILRVLRIFQFQPLMKRSTLTRVLYKSFNNVRFVLRNLLLFQFMMMYSYCLFGIRKFGHVKLSDGLDENFNFKTVGSSLRVLFMMSSMTGIDRIILPISTERDCISDHVDHKVLHFSDCGSATGGPLFVFSYTFFSFIIFTNLYFMFIIEITQQLKQLKKIPTISTPSSSKMYGKRDNKVEKPRPAANVNHR